MLLAYAKLSLCRRSAGIDGAGRSLSRPRTQPLFPAAIVEQFPDALEHHRLRREIIATQLANSMINRGGPSFVVRIADATGAAPAAIVAAFAAVRDSYGMTALNTEIDGLDNKIPGKLQLELYAAVQDLLLDRVVWFLRNVDLSKGLAAIVEHYRDGIAAVTAALDGALPEEAAKARAARVAELTKAGVPEALARRSPTCRCSRRRPISSWWPIAPSRRSREIAATYFAAEAFFRLDRIARAAGGIKVADYFDRLALDRALDTIGDAERRLAAAMAGNGVSGAAAVEAWVEPRQAEIERIRSVGARDRQFRHDAVEAVGDREPAERSGEAVDAARRYRSGFNALKCLCPGEAPWRCRGRRRP